MTTSVDLALRQYPALGSLEHSTRSISKFLGPPRSLSLSEGCKTGTVELLDLLWSSSCTDAKDRIPGWSLTNYLRSDPHYYRWQFSKSLYVAAERGDMAIVKWLLAHFQGCEASFEVVDAAAHGGHLHVLRFLWGYRSSVTLTKQVALGTMPCELPCTVAFQGNCCAKNWGETVMKKAVENGQLEECLGNGMTLGEHDKQIAIKHALGLGLSVLTEKLLPEGSDILDYAYECPQLEFIEKMVESGRVQWNEKYATSALSNVAKTGSVELMEQLLQLHSPLQEEHTIWKKAWDTAFSEACSHRKLEVVEWLMGHSLCHELCEKMKNVHILWPPLASATKGGHIEVMQYLHEHGFFTNISGNATRDGALVSVKWLARHIWDHPKQFHLTTANAVVCGRVDLLEFFQSLDGPQTGPLSPWCYCLISGAARNAPVKALQWLQENRPARCKFKTDNMDIAASWGHLDTVKWLHANRPEGCTGNAMLRAVRYGHFDMVQWLYENRSESRTNRALVHAIRYGHLRIAYWLRKKYPARPVELHERLAISNCWHSFDTLLFLRELYPGVFTSSFLRPIRDDYSGDYYKNSHTSDLVLGWLDTNYPRL